LHLEITDYLLKVRFSAAAIVKQVSCGNAQNRSV